MKSIKLKDVMKCEGEGETDWEALDKLTDEELIARAKADPDCPPLTDENMKNFRLASEFSHEELKKIALENKKNEIKRKIKMGKKSNHYA